MEYKMVLQKVYLMDLTMGSMMESQTGSTRGSMMENRMVGQKVNLMELKRGSMKANLMDLTKESKMELQKVRRTA